MPDPGSIHGCRGTATSGERLITLDALLDRFGDRLTYHVEIKQQTEGWCAVIRQVKERGLVDRVFIAAADNDGALEEAMRLAPGIRCAAAPVTRLRADGARAIAHCAAQGYAMVTLASSNHTRALVDQAHALGLEARSSGIASRAQMIEAAELGCNGMTINWPDWLIAYVRARAV